MSKKIAIYSGTFDPMTLGHLDIVSRSAKLFDTLIIAVAIAHHKQTMFSLAERLTQVRDACKATPNVLVLPFDGLIVDFCKSHNATAIVRGVRNSTDLDYEAQMAAMNQKMLPSVETVFLLPTPNVQCISSTLVREISKLKGDVTQMVSPNVLAALAAQGAK
ncbi:MAG: pantetheine-phosphate adenylyltransferase [Cytophagales bacterium]|nr:pantetheine-phosphate adenylyltransferase [Cytophagales bacterium]